MGFEEQTLIPRCQIGVFDGGSPDYESECGKPSVAFWNWGDGDYLFVCEEHNEYVEMCEVENHGVRISIFGKTLD